jgi:HSP20 family protein
MPVDALRGGGSDGSAGGRGGSAATPLPTDDSWDPERELQTLRDRVNRLFEESSNPEAGLWDPAVDVYETGPAVVLEAELPGVVLSAVEILVRGTDLILRGERPISQRGGVGPGGHQHLERSYGPFLRSFPLPDDARPERRQVSMENGVLRVVIPRG